MRSISICLQTQWLLTHWIGNYLDDSHRLAGFVQLTDIGCPVLFSIKKLASVPSLSDVVGNAREDGSDLSEH